MEKSNKQIKMQIAAGEAKHQKLLLKRALYFRNICHPIPNVLLIENINCLNFNGVKSAVETFRSLKNDPMQTCRLI